MALTVFYSWQNDHGPTRNFIKDALKKAIKSLNQEYALQEAERPDAIKLDHDTKGEPGSPSIFDTILKKIDGCGVFVADVTLVAKTKQGKAAPNPNVLIEYGYALKSLGDGRLVAVMNGDFGDAEALPFDLRHKRCPIAFRPEGNGPSGNRKLAKQQLVQELAEAIKLIIDRGLPEAAQPTAAEYIPVKPKSHVSSFLNDGELLCIREDPYSRKSGRKILWYNHSQMFLRLIPHQPPQRRTAGELLELIGQVGVNLKSFGNASFYGVQGNEYGTVVVGYIEQNQRTEVYCITQVFEQGEIWGIDRRILRVEQETIPWFEPKYARALKEYLDFARSRLSVRLPVIVVAGMTGVRGYSIQPPRNSSPDDWPRSRCVKNNVIKEITVQDVAASPKAILIPFFDEVFGACQSRRPSWLPQPD